VNTRTVPLNPVFDKPCYGDGSRPQRVLTVVSQTYGFWGNYPRETVARPWI